MTTPLSNTEELKLAQILNDNIEYEAMDKYAGNIEHLIVFDYKKATKALKAYADTLATERVIAELQSFCGISNDIPETEIKARIATLNVNKKKEK